MKLAVENSCATCDAFLVNKALQVKVGLPRQGWCRANPPALVQAMMQIMTPRGPEVQPGFQGAFPPVTSDWWCRQWRFAGRVTTGEIIDHEDISDAANKGISDAANKPAA